MAEIRLEQLCKSFGDTTVIRDVSLSIPDGEFCVFVGPSGCGKSTLLRLIAGLESPGSGRVFIDDRDVTTLEPYDRQLSMVFQSYALYPHMSVRKNIEFALRTARLPESVIAAKVTEASRMLRLDDYLARKPAELSGGQRQRVAIGRAVVREPRAFLFDEPLSNLDAALRADTRMEIASLHKALGATMVYVTHDQVEAMTLADRIVVINQGAIEQIGTPRDLYRAPATTFVATFLGNPRMNLLPATVEGGRLVIDGRRLSVTATPGTRIDTLGVRPEDVQLLAPGSGWLDARVAACEFHGSVLSVMLTMPGGQGMCALVAPDTAVNSGDTVGLGFDTQRLHAFDERGMRVATVPAGAPPAGAPH